MNLEQVKKLNIPQKPGCYQYFNRTGKIIYIGKAANLKSRVLSYWQKSAEHTPAKWAMLKRIAQIKWIETDSEIEALLLESNLVKKHQPEFNVMLRDDKRFCYIKVALEDEIPGIFITRKLDRAGRYFGPFVSAIAVRETVKAIRKIWPYCTEAKIKNKPCFYAQIGRCLGVCGGRISKQEYMKKVIRPIILFLEGKKQLIINNYELRIKKLEKEIKKEKDPDKIEELAQEFGRLKFQLGNMKNVLAHANILGLIDKYATDVVELAKLLGLPRVPQRTEGYDISNIFGKEAVGSMVVFTDGEPDKNEYRKFKIRIGQGMANDVGMLKEVLERRLRHSVILRPQAEESRSSDRNEILRSAQDDKRGWPLPDLIIIDGGKGQVNIAAAVLKKTKLDIPIIGISKGNGLRSAMAPDKLFFPGEKKPLQLPLASPAMHIIKRVRDEAHRFAIGYHRKLRSKKFI
jgi:excinuclease ABC subunit C